MLAPKDFVFRELSVPRRPPWDASTSSADLDKAEKESFLEWRRAIAQREEALAQESSRISVTPFEKNLQVWRQLWRVLERSSCLVQIVDGRNPLFYLSRDLRKYTTEELGKPMILLINKSDYLSKRQRDAWHVYLKHTRMGSCVFLGLFRTAKARSTRSTRAAAIQRIGRRSKK